MSKVTGTLSHDTISRWLENASFRPSDLWRQVKGMVSLAEGYLVADDTLLDKRYSRSSQIARPHYSGNAHGVVKGIPLVNLLWTKGEEYIPVDYRVYEPTRDDKTKHNHFQEMLKRAKKRGFEPRFVLMDAWYGSLDNLKYITRDMQWHFITNLKTNRQVSITKGVYVPISDLNLAESQVRHVWLKGFGPVLVCKTVDTNGDVAYLATSDLSLTDHDTFLAHFDARWKIEEFHRGLKQTTGVEQCYSVKADSQRTHIFASFVAFVKLEATRLADDVSWYEQKAAISRQAARAQMGFA